jgi:ABC-type transport system substrate-binding protein
LIRSRRVGGGECRPGRVAIAVIVALSLAGTTCSLGGAESPPGSTGPALAGGTLHLALRAKYQDLEDDTTLDPAAPYDPSYRIGPEILRCCLVRTLLSYSGLPTERGGTELRPDLASAMPKLSQDRLTWTFRLRRGLHYAPPLDEVEITAADIVRGIERTATVGVSDGTYSSYYSVIQGYDAFARGETDSIPGLEVVDDHTLGVHLTEVTNDLGYRMALPGSAPIPPSPRDPDAPYGAADGHGKGYGPYLIASGPYMIQGADRLAPWKPAADQPRSAGLTRRSLTLVRNPSWDRSTDHIHGAYVDRIEFRTMSQGEAERELDQGAIDTIFSASSVKQIDRYRADPELRPLVASGTFDSFVGYTAMNLAMPPFDDLHVRRAVNLAYEADRWLRVANRHYSSGLGFGPLGHVAPDATEDDLLRGQRRYPFDPAAARAEMARSRYDRNGDGICDDPACKDVFALETDSGFEKFADRVWVDDLKAIGITLDIRRVADYNKYTEMSLDPTARVALNLGGFSIADYPNASNLFATLFTSEGVRGTFNQPSPDSNPFLLNNPNGNESLVGVGPRDLKRWGYPVATVPNVDAEIDECLSLIGFEQTRCWAELDQLLMTQIVPWVPQCTLEYGWIRSERLVRFPIDQALTGWPALDQIAIAPGSD